MRWFLAALLLSAAAPAAAQETLADIRQDLVILNVEVQKLRRELSTTGGAGTNLQGTDILTRVDAIEAELARLTSKTEEVSNRVDRVVSDGTNRIGDLEFRLCELETNCDISTLGETSTLGGGDMPAITGGGVAPDATGGGAVIGAAPLDGGGTGGAPLDDIAGVELAVAERDDFERARAAFDAGNYADAADRFQRFTDTYQGGPLTGLAHLLRGEALQKQGLTSSAARAYLESYSGQPDGAAAPRALLNLGLALDGLGQTSEACITLAEVTVRFPASDSSVEAQTARANMGCS
jgi:tol-pal system protein YbgF